VKKLLPLLIAAALLLSFSPTLLAAPDAFGYDCQVVTPTYIEASTYIGLAGDDEYQEVTLPFSFPFYGTDYNSVFVNTNGFLSFLSGYQSYYNNYAIPDLAATPNAAIYALWDDLYVDGAASMHTEQLASPNRFVIEWRNVNFLWGTGTQRVDFEVVLHETGDILVQYRNISDDSLEQGVSATLGIENEAGTIAYQYSYNTAVLPVGDSALLYSVRSSETVVPSMAAPNIAEIILEAEGVDANQSFGKGKSRTFLNLIQQTAANMGPQTDFDGVSKYVLVGEPGEEVESLSPDYWQAVLDFLNARIAFYGLGIGPLTYSYDDYVEDQYGPGPGTLPFSEDFTGVASGEIPVGWSETAAYANWAVQNTNYAYGYSPEMMFNWTPSFNDISRLISPEIDAGAYSSVNLTFAHMVSNFDSYTWPYVLKVQVSLDGGTNWTDAWSLAPWGVVPAEVVTVDLTTYAGQSFKLAWVFSGDSFGINYWYIDDILVTGS